MLRVCTAFVLATMPVAHLVAAPAVTGVIEVVDADTWDVGGARVRLHGIDAPEAAQTCRRADGSSWRCGDWATRQTRLRFQGRHAVCTPVDTDRYGRIVARCMVGGRDAGRELVAEGVAFAFRRYSMDYDLDEKGAAVNARGLHAGQVQRPSDYRAARRDAGAAAAQQVAAANAGCPIKGNVSSKGARIYHMPGQQHYDRTRINPAKGERWFCSEAEARAAGWRRARR
ncbi:thermonuclease family protein [Pukyongiella litopenaei]|uniref:Thermonuclease family protein n=2 Tax=Pukyongiella litopenaei TaxID=2605946 RepID=A0A2S0MKV1_9RHOB|nr:thermonuclease family protein [Pukyongiella litopenaei]